MYSKFVNKYGLLYVIKQVVLANESDSVGICIN